LTDFSILDLAYIREGGDAAEALAHTTELAQRAESWGYRRFWLAEHHNTTGNASSATAVLIAHIASRTRSIRVGAGGIMLPVHAPLIVAEQFGTLEALYPNRIDLGLGRAAGTAHEPTLRALHRQPGRVASFPQDVQELQLLLGPPQPWQSVQAIPGTGLEVPLWLLGAGVFGAQLAAEMGLPFAFAAHILPGDLMAALAAYREKFRPSRQLAQPRAMVSINAVAADSDEEARHLFTTVQQISTDNFRNHLCKLKPPIADIDAYWTAAEKAVIEGNLGCSFVGARESVRQQLQDFLARTGADELIVNSAIFDHAARLRSYEIMAEVQASL
jgi:luciferase family oxidoreductase group 1